MKLFQSPEVGEGKDRFCVEHQCPNELYDIKSKNPFQSSSLSKKHQSKTVVKVVKIDFTWELLQKGKIEPSRELDSIPK